MSADRTLKIAVELLTDRKYFYVSQLAGVVGTLVDHYNCALDQDTVDAVKEAVCEVFESGCEPEFESEHSWRVWEELSPTSFERHPVRGLEWAQHVKLRAT